MAYARRVDKNQADIVAHLRTVPGVTVFHLHRVGHGFPDLIVGYQGVNYLMEIKDGSGKLTADEKDFFELWRGQVTVVRDFDDALGVLGL